ncbi:MAG TPA: hypothetical protein VF743_03400, partial [Acidimicrobiales bacterium]
MDDFYGRFGQVSFTLLGLWLIIVQTRFAAWSADRRRRRQATAVALVFGLPGTMSFVSTVEPTEPVLWRVSFVVGGALGALGLLSVAARPALRPTDSPTAVALWTGGAIQVAITLVAALASVVDGTILDLAPLQMEALL